MRFIPKFPAGAASLLVFALLSTDHGQGATAIVTRLELIDAQLFGDYAVGTLYLRVAADAQPIVDKQVSIKIHTTRADSGWYHYRTDARGAFHFRLPRLRDAQGGFVTSCSLNSEFSVVRSSSDPTREIYPAYLGTSVSETIPYGRGFPPITIIGPPTADGISWTDTCVPQGVDSRFASLSYAADANLAVPNSGIEDWFWAIRNPQGTIFADNGPTVIYRATATGTYEVRLTIWDHNGRVGSTTRSFQVSGTQTNGFLRDWNPCPGGDASQSAISDAFGTLELECEAGAVRARWRTADGKLRTIGQCLYRLGESACTYTFDSCKNRYTKLVWRNEEGHDLSTPRWTAYDQNGNGGYDYDEYVFYPESNELAINHCQRSIASGVDVGVGRCVAAFPRTPVLTATDADQADAGLLALRQGLGYPIDVLNSGEGNNSVMARVLVYGTSPVGTIRLGLGGTSMAVAVPAGLASVKVAELLVSAVNNDPNLAAAAIRAVQATALASNLAEVILENVLSEEASFAVEAAGSYSFGFLPGRSWPEISAHPNGTNLVVSWPQTSLPFALEAGSLSANGFAWQAVGAGVLWSTNAGRVSAQLPRGGDSGFYRLALRP